MVRSILDDGLTTKEQGNKLKLRTIDEWNDKAIEALSTKLGLRVIFALCSNDHIFCPIIIHKGLYLPRKAWMKGYIQPLSMHKASYLTVNILILKGIYDPHTYFRGKYNLKNTSGHIQYLLDKVYFLSLMFTLSFNLIFMFGKYIFRSFLLTLSF